MQVQPYHVTRHSDELCSFETDDQITYRCEFINVTELEEQLSLYDIQLISFSFFPEQYNPAVRWRKRPNGKIAVTIAAILQQKLLSRRRVLLFTCDDTFQAPESRQRLFEGWHKLFGKNTDLVLFPNETFRADQEAAGVKTMIGGLLMRSDFEHHKFILNLMEEVLPALYREKNGI